MFKKKSLLLSLFLTFISLAYLNSYPHSGGSRSSRSSSSRSHSGSRSFSYPKSSRSNHYSSSSYGTSSRRYRGYHSGGVHDDENNKSLKIFLLIWGLCTLFALIFLVYWTGQESEKVIKGHKNYVYRDYDKIVSWFDENRSREGYEKKYLDQVLEKIPFDGTVLDLGCGMGEPISQYFIEKRYQLIGVDGSAKLIELAKQRLPSGQFLVEDMRLISLSQKFDCVIAWHSFFHLPPNDQRKMFETFQQHLKNDGILLFTTGPNRSEVWSNNGGINMYHASLSALQYRKLLKQHCFELILHVVEDRSCGDATVWIAKLNQK